jgi:hypothetical protein
MHFSTEQHKGVGPGARVVEQVAGMSETPNYHCVGREPLAAELCKRIVVLTRGRGRGGAQVLPCTKAARDAP